MIRLLTFSQLSLLRENPQVAEELARSLHQLSTIARTFDCHLLQRSSRSCIFDALGDDSQQTRFENTVGMHGSDVIVVSAGHSADAVFPEWMNADILTEQPVESVRKLVIRTNDDSSDVRFQWTHVELPNDNAGLVWLQAALSAAVLVAQEHPDDRLVVTAVAGTDGDSNRFESLLWEENVRLPLLIGGKGIECERVSCPTGSFDILETLLADFGEEAAPTGKDRPASLGGQLHEVPLRAIQVTQGEADAVRTSDFFLVRLTSELQGEQVALYGKPHDVWNIHDLSHEYPDVTDSLLAQLPERVSP